MTKHTRQDASLASFVTEPVKGSLIAEMPPEQRPYEKCLARGPGALTDTELLAVILRTGVCGHSSLELSDAVLQALHGKNKGLLGLHHFTLQELLKIRGIGKVKAIQLKCIAELSVRMAQTLAKDELSYDHPETIANYYMESLRHKEQEVLLCMMLDTKNHLLGEEIVSRGTVNASLISPRDLFLRALKYQAVHLILIHNHPSGDAAPSKEDIAITQRIFQAGELLDVHLLDHIVIGDRQYVSFREQKLL